MTCHGGQFYSGKSSAGRMGEEECEHDLIRLGMGHKLSGPSHPQTNGQTVVPFGEIKHKSRMFAGPGACIVHFSHIYNGRSHDSLDDGMVHG